MKTMSLFVAAAVCALAGCPARGSGTVVVGDGTGPTRPDPRPRPPVVVVPGWDSTGWELLGTQAVNGKVDHDTIKVGVKEGKYDALTVVVGDSDLEMHSFVVTFGNGRTWDANLKHFFREGQRTFPITLPGEDTAKSDRKIQKIDIVYGNIPGGGNATVEVWGRYTGGKKPDAGGPPPPPKPEEPPPPPAEPAFDAKGWSLLGAQTVEGKKDKDVIKVGKKAGKFTKVTIVVTDSDLELQDFIVTFNNGEKFDPKLRHAFKEGSRSRAIDLPGEARFIKHIEVKYGNLPGGGKAKLEVYGKE
jgi:hypothetical protein